MSGLTVAEVLDRAADLIEPEGAWIKGDIAKTKDRGIVSAKAPDAVCFCVGGAICRIGPDYLTQSAAIRQLREVIGGERTVSSWNDAPERTHAEVLGALRKAAACARGQGVSHDH